MQEVDNRTRSADDLLVSVMNNSTPPQVDLPDAAPVESKPSQEPEAPEVKEVSAEQPDNSAPQASANQETDEYGNPVKVEPEMISMEEHKRRLNEIMRNRTKNWSQEDQQRFMAQQNVPQNVPHGTICLALRILRLATFGRWSSKWSRRGGQPRSTPWSLATWIFGRTGKRALIPSRLTAGTLTESQPI